MVTPGQARLPGALSDHRGDAGPCLRLVAVVLAQSILPLGEGKR